MKSNEFRVQDWLVIYRPLSLGLFWHIIRGVGGWGGMPKVDGTKKRPHWGCKLTNSGSEKHSLLILGQSVRDPPRLKDSNIKNLKSRITGWSY